MYYRWIDYFETRPHGLSAQILMIASLHHIDDDYRTRRVLKSEPPMPRPKPKTDADWDRLIDAATSEEQAMALRRARYTSNGGTMDLAEWEARARQAHWNSVKGNQAQREAFDRVGVRDNNAADAYEQFTVREPVSGRNVTTRPDGVTDTHLVDSKSFQSDAAEQVVYFEEQLRAQAMAAAQSNRGLGVVIVSDNPAARPSSEFWGNAMDTIARSAGRKPGVVVVRRAPGSGRWYVWDPRRNRWTASTMDEVRGLLGGGV